MKKAELHPTIQGLSTQTKAAVRVVYQKMAKKKRKRAGDLAIKHSFQRNKLIANM